MPYRGPGASLYATCMPRPCIREGAAWAWVALVLAASTACERQPAWQPIRGPGFVAELPGTPAHSEDVSENPAITRAEKWVSTLGEGRGGYIISHLEYDPGIMTPALRDVILERMDEGVLPGGERRRLRRTDLRAGRDTWPGRELETAVPNENAMARVRIYVVRNHVYSLSLVYRPPASLDAEYERMIAGFALAE